MSNLITNPNFATDTTGWTLGDFTRVTSLPHTNGLPSGISTALKIDQFSSNDSAYFTFTASATTYYIRFYILFQTTGTSNLHLSPINIRLRDSMNTIVYSRLYDDVLSTLSWTNSVSTADGTGTNVNSITLTGPTSGTCNLYIQPMLIDSAHSYYITSIYVGTDSSVVCFNKGTKILSLRNNIEMYIPIEELNKETDLVKTYLHGFKKINNIGHSVIVNDTSDFTKSMYIMEKQGDMIDDLIVTGGHSILEDEYDNTETKSLHMELFGGSLDPIDDKVLVLAGKSSKFRQIDNKETYDIYHIALGEDESEDNRYGIWANGILTESTFKKVLYKMISFN